MHWCRIMWSLWHDLMWDHVHDLWLKNALGNWTLKMMRKIMETNVQSLLHRSDITFIFYFIWNECWVTERNVTSAGPESCAGDAGGGRSAGHVPGLCGTSALHAHQRHGLLERMERVGLLHTSEQQRYCRTPLISLLENTSLLRWWQCWWRDYIQASGISAHGDWHKRYTSCISSEVKVVM